MCSKECSNNKNQLKAITKFYMNFNSDSSCSENELDIAAVVLLYLYEPLATSNVKSKITECSSDDG